MHPHGLKDSLDQGFLRLDLEQLLHARVPIAKDVQLFMYTFYM
jgi:hypothetical protein